MLRLGHVRLRWKTVKKQPVADFRRNELFYVRQRNTWIWRAAVKNVLANRRSDTLSFDVNGYVFV